MSSILRASVSRLNKIHKFKHSVESMLALKKRGVPAKLK